LALQLIRANNFDQVGFDNLTTIVLTVSSHTCNVPLRPAIFYGSHRNWRGTRSPWTDPQRE